MKRFTIYFLFLLLSHNATAQYVGIGTNAPKARLHVADSSVVFSANGDIPASPGPAPVLGTGRRMMWYADKAAFRAGYASSTNWDTENVGDYSFAVGLGSRATGVASVALGSCSASGSYSFAAGNSSESTNGGIALGLLAKSYGSNAVAIGRLSQSDGNDGVALGFSTFAFGNYSVAIGSNSVASGLRSVALGHYVSTNDFSGAFILGDNSTTTIESSIANNTFTARFAGGYRLFSNSATSVGVQLAAGGNAWLTISDIRRKENFAAIDGEAFLQKIKAIPMHSWNYIGQDPANFRHYGPMAQDFYAAFGRDVYGNIGNDSTINQADFDGVNMIAIKALEKRTADLQKENELLKAALLRMEAKLEELGKGN